MLEAVCRLSCGCRSERSQERRQISLLLIRQLHLKPLVVELHDLIEIRRGAVVEVRRPGRQPAQDRALDAADVGALARDQGAARVRGVPDSARERTRKTGHLEDWQI